MTKTELAEAAETLREELLRGASEDDAQDLLGLDTEDFRAVRSYMLDGLAAEQREMSREHRYARYVLEQQNNIRDLSELINTLEHKSQFNAVVGALRLRSEIQERVIDRGFTLGVIEKEPDKSQTLVGGFILSNMSDKDLRKAILKQGGKLGDMLSRYGESPIGAIAVGQTHFDAEGETVED